jgi:hypothetical protein
LPLAKLDFILLAELKELIQSFEKARSFLKPSLMHEEGRRLSRSCPELFPGRVFYVSALPFLNGRALRLTYIRGGNRVK